MTAATTFLSLLWHYRKCCKAIYLESLNVPNTFDFVSHRSMSINCWCWVCIVWWGLTLPVFLKRAAPQSPGQEARLMVLRCREELNRVTICHPGSWSQCWMNSKKMQQEFSATCSVGHSFAMAFAKDTVVSWVTVCNEDVWHNAVFMTTWHVCKSTEMLHCITRSCWICKDCSCWWANFQDCWWIYCFNSFGAVLQVRG